MKKLVLTLIGVIVGIFVIPALFAFALGVGGTILGFIAEPKVMMVMVGILAIISLPGMLLMWFVKK